LSGVPLGELGISALAEIVGTAAVVAPVASELSSEPLPTGGNLPGLLDQVALGGFEPEHAAVKTALMGDASLKPSRNNLIVPAIAVSWPLI